MAHGFVGVADSFPSHLRSSPHLWSKPGPVVQKVQRTAALEVGLFARQSFCHPYSVVVEHANLTIDHFMTTDPCTVNADLSLFDAQDRMAANNIRHLLVERSGRLAGLVSARDIGMTSSLIGVDPRRTTVAQAMSERVYTCAPKDTLVDVAHEMEAHRLGCAVVVEHDIVVGIFTTTDALRALRQVIVGAPVDRAVTPSHRTESDPRARDLVRHPMRLSDSLRAHGVLPSSTQGTFR